jgi:iron complex transport system substrate-binding protein
VQKVDATANSSIVDASGKTVRVKRPYMRIISLYSAHTENICSLGAQEQLIGISRSDDYPPSITEKQRFSYREDPEKFIGSKPDLVLIRPMINRSYPEFINKLQKAGITVISLQPTSVEGMFEYWQKLGILTGKTRAADEMINIFHTRLSIVKERVEKIADADKPKVYFESIHKKMKTFAPESIAIFVLQQAGGVNIAADATQVRKTNIASFGKEKLISRGKDVDIFLAQHGRMNPVSLDIINKEPGFSALKAVQNKGVYLIEESLVSRPTLRILDGIEQLNNILYP